MTLAPHLSPSAGENDADPRSLCRITPFRRGPSVAALGHYSWLASGHYGNCLLHARGTQRARSAIDGDASTGWACCFHDLYPNADWTDYDIDLQSFYLLDSA